MKERESMKKLTATYLYADGHAVCCYEKTDRDAGEIRYCEVHEQFTKAHCGFVGRIVIGRWQEGLSNLMKGALKINVSAPSTELGSENTRKQGIAVGNLSVQTKGGELYWTTMPELISPAFNYQPGNVEVFEPEMMFWHDLRVAKIHRISTAPVAQKEAA